MQFTEHGCPRRSYIDRLTTEERELVDLMAKIEGLGAHPLLTECIVALDTARSRLADWVELPHSDQEQSHD